MPGAPQTQVLHELLASPLVGHFGRDKTLALARRQARWPGLPAAVAGREVRAHLPDV